MGERCAVAHCLLDLNALHAGASATKSATHRTVASARSPARIVVSTQRCSSLLRRTLVVAAAESCAAATSSKEEKEQPPSEIAGYVGLRIADLTLCLLLKVVCL